MPLARSLLALPLAVLLAAPSLASAQDPSKPAQSSTDANAKPAKLPEGHSTHGEAFNDGPRQAARIVEGMGKIRFPVTTASPEAQAFVTQGVAQLHTFFYFEAERSFRQAAKIDSNCAMAYWGMAMANVNNAKRARGFLIESQKPERLAKVTPREKLYIEGLDAFHQEKSDEKTRRQALLSKLETIVQDHPDDLDARAWLAMVTWQNGDKDGIGSRQAVDSLIGDVLREEPLHPGAHHYRIHLWDHRKAKQALPAAALYAKAAPGIAHAWHMPGHTYSELKRYSDAAYQQEGSARADHAYMIRDRVLPFKIHNYAHNNEWLARTLNFLGRAKDAVAIARDLTEQPRDPQQNDAKNASSSQRFGRKRWAETLIRFELWDDLIQAGESGALDWSDVGDERIDRAYSLGLAYASKKDLPKLAEQVAALREELDLIAREAKNKDKDKDKTKDAKPKADAPKPKTREAASKPAVESALAELEGWQYLLAGDSKTALSRFEKANRMLGESKARVRLLANQPKEAEDEAGKAARNGENQAAPLAAQVEVLLAVGKMNEAREAYRKLLGVAAEADSDLPVLKRLKSAAATAAAWDVKDLKPEVVQSGPHAPDRINLDTVGPLTWHPFPALNFAIADTEGRTWSLADHRGKMVLVLFYLGGDCAHCMRQLRAFSDQIDALKALNIDVVAISTDDLDKTKGLKKNEAGIKFPMPLLADPELKTFKAYQVHDDFEDAPLHGTFLIDPRGQIRYQRVSADPFMDIDFIKAEAARIRQ